MSKRSGVTLVELLVVLLVIGLTTALIAPSLIVHEPSTETPIDALLARAVDLATAREQSLSLVVRADGRWRVHAARPEETLAEGQLPGGSGHPFALRVSSLGTCGPEPGESLPFELDPLLCEIR